MKYHSGEEIRKGDKVIFEGVQGEIEFIVDSPTGDQAMDWYITEHGRGVMFADPKVFGHAYIVDTENAVDLILVSRGI